MNGIIDIYTKNLFKSIALLVVLVLCIGLRFSVCAQENFDRFQHLSVSTGFSFNPVTSITQDQKGLMWFGTRLGLMRYDGVRLKKIADSPGEVFSFTDNDIYVIYPDSKGRIWVGTPKCVSFYDPETNTGRNFLANELGVGNFPAIICITELKSGEIWIGTASRGIFVYDPKIDRFAHIINDPDDIHSLSHKRVNCIYQASDGSVWVGTNNGLNKLISDENRDYKFQVYRHIRGKKESLINNRVNTIIQDNKGRIWVGTHRGLDYLNISGGGFVHWSTNKNNTLTNDFVRALAMDKNGRIWVGTYDGLNIINERKLFRRIFHDENNPHSLTGNKIRALYTDKNGTVWIGSYYGGIDYWDENHLNFTRIDENYRNHLSHHVVSSLAQDDMGNIYIGTEGSGLNIIDVVTKKYEQVNVLKNGQTLGTTKSMLVEGDNIWVGTFDKGLFKVNLKTKEYKQYQYEQNNTASLNNDVVISIVKSYDDKIWVGTHGGLNLFDPKKETFRRFYRSNLKVLAPTSVRSIVIDDSEDCYIASYAGLHILRKEKMEKSEYDFEHIEFSGEFGSTPELVDIFIDHEKNVWLGSANYGLLQLVDNVVVNPKISSVKSVMSITQDNNGLLWLSSKTGIASVDAKNRITKVYNIKDGVQPNEFIMGASLYSNDGRVYFGGASGLTTFRPDALGQYNNYVPDVQITDFQLFDKLLSAGDTTGVLTKSIGYSDEITLDYDQNIFTIHFSLPNYIKTDKNAFQYRLVGLEDNWNYTTDPSVSYTIQKGGVYTFEVKGENSDGFKTENVTQLKINVLNPPWRTWWAFLSYGILIAFCLYFLISVFRSRIALEHKLEMETRELLKQEEVNQQKLQFFTNISHEFRTPLTLILGPLQKIIDEYKGSNAVFRQLLVIKRNTDQLFKLINELMDFRKLENKQMKLQAAKGNIVKFVHEVFLSFKQQARMGQYKYSFESEKEEIDIYFDRDKLEKVVFNLISNAFKYTGQKGSVLVVVKEVNNAVEIEVKDTGDGIPKNELPKVFDRFYEVPGQKHHGKFKQGSGIGLAIVKSIVDLHKGKVRVESAENKGSSFIVTLPFGRAHLKQGEIISEFKNSDDISQYEAQLTAVAGMTQNEEIWAEGLGADAKLVLVAEDNREVGNFIRGILSRQYRITLVENGAEGYKKAISEQPDLIISDVMMPEMDGIEFCSKSKSDIRTSHIPFILLTARTSLVYKYDGLESGADEYLNKPFQIKELLLKCKNILNTQEKLKEKFAENGELNPAEVSVNSLDKKMMDHAIQIIRDNISNQFFNISLFCTQLGTSRSVLYTKFKAWTNQTPNDFILNMRMRHAATLIEQEGANITYISEKVGFKDPNYFSKCFKSHFNITPKQYAKKFASYFD